MKIAVVGATGLVGSKMLQVLDEQKVQIDELIVAASERSVGKEIVFQGKTYKVVSVDNAIAARPDITICMVEQLGLAMMCVSLLIVSALISGTTKGTSFSMRQAELLSTTKVPCSAKRGAYCFDADAPAEKMVMSGRAAMALSTLTTL